MKFSIKDFSNKCDQIRRKLQIWLHLLKKFLMGNLIFCGVQVLKYASPLSLLDFENLFFHKKYFDEG